MRKIGLALCLLLGGVCHAQFQIVPEIWVEELSIPGFPAFHSGAVAQDNGKWFIIGGRTNGMHGFYPPFAFPNNGKQNQIYVVEPTAGAVWSMGLDSLSVPLQEQLSSSNMQFAQHNGKLYIAGGYGYHAAIDDFTTFPYLTSVDLASLADSVIAGGNPAPCFKTVTDSSMAVAGGRLGRVGNRYFLACGHYFHHRYSVQDLGSFIQRYTYQIRMFNIKDSANVLALENKEAITDSVHFRRRDFNMTAYSEGLNGEGLMIWSGVFRDSVDLPHYRPIRVHADGTYEVLPLEQKMAHYQSGAMSIKGNNEQHFPGLEPYLHFFFGGMAEYYRDSSGQVVQDSLVPFVKTFSSVSINDDNLTENPYGPLTYPFDYGGQNPDRLRYAFEEFEGTNVDFIPNPQYLLNNVDVISIDPNDFTTPTLLGNLVGGIESTGRNIADLNDPSLSFASDKIYVVYYQLAMVMDIAENAPQAIRVYPNPVKDVLRVDLTEPIQRREVLDVTGKTVLQTQWGDATLNVSQLQPGTYFLKVFTKDKLYRSTFVKQ